MSTPRNVFKNATKTYVYCACVALGIASLQMGCSTTESSSAKKDPGPDKTDKAYYEAAQKSLKSQQYDGASRYLKALETYYPTSAYTEQSQLDYMYSLYRQSDYAGAISAAERFIRINPTSTQLDYAFYVRGVCNMEMNANTLMHFFRQDPATRDLSSLRAAFDIFKTLLIKFPNSRYAPDSAQRMRYIRDQTAQNELAVAQYYMTRGAYLAAITRASALLQYFPSSSVTPDALTILVDAYNKTNNPAQADKYNRVLTLNFADKARAQRTPQSTTEKPAGVLPMDPPPKDALTPLEQISTQEPKPSPTQSPEIKQP